MRPHLKVVLLAGYCIFANWFVYAESDCEKQTFWNKPIRKGANIFNVLIFQKDIKAAKKYGVGFVRLALDRFPTKRRDFLIGDADEYKGLDKKDLATLKNVLKIFEKEGMPVVITMISLPGSRWKQLNNNKDDLKIWRDLKYQKQAARFWRDLAVELRNCPIVVGYNILNEPHPERLFNAKNCHVDKVNQPAVQQLLFRFYRLVVNAIRSVDKHTAIILDSSAYGDPNTFKYLQPLNDDRVLYSFHMYEPYEYTNHKLNDGKYSYPGVIDGKFWDKKALSEYMKSVATFQKTNKIPPTKILVGEFGCYRKTKGIVQYFCDLIQIFEENGWHLAFYSFREDSRDGMDYELGDKKLPWAYWKAFEKWRILNSLRKATFPQFAVLENALKSQRSNNAAKDCRQSNEIPK
ncbi:MAG: glycoside hydrolase family 5 protein [Holosporales bacterium]|jgi:hypothetical protein|nr:glycoside hydrolase family 5 protein [Holosporales bacterium]